jgi:hypothetical protein
MVGYVSTCGYDRGEVLYLRGGNEPAMHPPPYCRPDSPVDRGWGKVPGSLLPVAKLGDRRVVGDRSDHRIGDTPTGPIRHRSTFLHSLPLHTLPINTRPSRFCIPLNPSPSTLSHHGRGVTVLFLLPSPLCQSTATGPSSQRHMTSHHSSLHGSGGSRVPPPPS